MEERRVIEEKWVSVAPVKVLEPARVPQTGTPSVYYSNRPLHVEELVVRAPEDVPPPRQSAEPAKKQQGEDAPSDGVRSPGLQLLGLAIHASVPGF